MAFILTVLNIWGFCCYYIPNDFHVLIYSSSVKNAVAILTKTPITLEVLYGNQLTINCTIEGGRRPDYLKLSSTTATIAEFNSDMSTVTSKTDNSVTYIHQTTAKYTDTSTSTCLGKNKAKGGVETEDSKTVQVIVGKFLIVKKSLLVLKSFLYLYLYSYNYFLNQ